MNLYKRLNLKQIKNENNLIEKKDYIIFFKKNYARSFDVIHNFNKTIFNQKISNGYIFLYAIPNILSDCESNELKNKLLITISEYHINFINSSDKYINLKTIIKDGSLFMNKLILKDNKYFLNENSNIELIKKTILDCYELAYKLHEQTKDYLNINWCVYKSTNIKMIDNTLDYIIPFSTSSDFNVCKNWKKEIIYKILIDKNTPIICLERVYDHFKENIYSYIYKYFNIYNTNNKKINENIEIIKKVCLQENYNELYEGEVFLLPGKLTYISQDIIEFNDIDPITLITCMYEKYDLIDIINKII